MSPLILVQKNEIICTLKSLKNGKASNDLPAEFYKYSAASEALIEELEALFETDMEYATSVGLGAL